MIDHSHIHEGCRRVCLLLGLIAAVTATACTRKSKSSQAARSGPAETNTVSLEGQGRVEFMFGPDLGCVMGDMDTIAAEVYRKSNQRLLFTVEPVLPEDNGKFKPIVKQIEFGAALAGVTVDFNLPKVAVPTHLGLFICKDNKREGHCNTKKPYNLGKMTEILFFQGPMRSKKILEADKPYFFQYLLLDDKEIRFMSRAINTEFKFNRFAHNLIKTLPGSKRQHQKALAQVGKTQKMLSSNPLSVVSNGRSVRIEARLPMMDAKNCATNTTNDRGEAWKPRLSPPDPNYRPKTGKMMIPRAPDM